MTQTALVEGLHKETVDDPSIARQKASIVGSQDSGGLFKPTARLNRIHGNGGRTEGPHPPQLSSHFPTRFVGCDAGTGTNLLDQLLIGGFRLLRHPFQGLAQSPTADR